MSWFGKLVGGTIGLMIGGPLGAIAGGALGHHLFDREHAGQERLETFYRRPSVDQRQAAYFLTLFSLLGKLAKADGQVTQAEGEKLVSFLDHMRLHGETRTFAIRVFNEAKDSPYTVEQLAQQFAVMTQGRRDLRHSMLDMLFQIALADGHYHPSEEEMIGRIAGVFGVSEAELDALRQRYVGTTSATNKAYATLGLTPDADDDTVRITYRRLVQEYHPDRIVSHGLPDEFVDYATGRFQEIQAAWEEIKKARGL